MNNLTWLDLYNHLHKIANNINTVGQFNWNEPVVIHNAETGDENTCDTWIITDSSNKDKFFLVINTEAIFGEADGSSTTE